MGAQFSCHRKEERLTNAMPTSKTAKETIRREHYAIPTAGGVQDDIYSGGYERRFLACQIVRTIKLPVYLEYPME